MCGNIAYAEQSFDPARGSHSVEYRTPVGTARKADGLCGPEALLWEPKNLLTVAVAGLGTGVGRVAAAIAVLLVAAGVLSQALGY